MIGGQPRRFETLHRVATGERVPVEVTSNYLDHDGKGRKWALS
jgi:hypothetical protein